jgi:hypothetical protein
MAASERENQQTFTVQFMDGRGNPLGGPGVDLDLYVDGRKQSTISKSSIQTVRLKFPRGHDTKIIARIAGHEPQTIVVGPDAAQHNFRFPGAGQPVVMIVCTKDCESAAVRAVFDHYGEPIGRPNDPNIYRVGLYRVNRRNAVRNVLTVASGMGNQAAGAVTTQALNSFPGIEHILLVGMAGGCQTRRNPMSMFASAI